MAPLIVSIDTEGNNMFIKNKEYYAERKETCEQPIIGLAAHCLDAEAQ